MKRLALLAVAMTLLLSAYPSRGQEANNTTTTVVPEIRIVNVTVPEAAVAKAYLKTVAPGVLEVHLYCFYPRSPSECPNATLAIVAGGNVTWASNVTVADMTCYTSFCEWASNVTGVPPSGELRYALYYPDGRIYTYSIPYRFPEGFENPILQYVYNLLPFALAAGLGVRGDLRLAGAGLIAGGVAVYLAALNGMVPLNYTVVYLSIVFGAILLWVAR